MAEESSSVRRPNFSQEETDVLVREVQARSVRIYGTVSRPPRADDAKVAWEEVTTIVNQCCVSLVRSLSFSLAVSLCFFSFDFSKMTDAEYILPI